MNSAVVFLLGTLYFYVYTQVQSKAANKKIWVPPKAKPSLPFGLGPPPAPITKEEYEVTTYKEYELKLLKEAATPLFMTVAMTMFMSIKFSIHMSLLMQSIMIPLNATDSPILRKYLLGARGGKNVYGELFHSPTDEDIARANPAGAAAGAEAEPAGPAAEPRVVELPLDEEPAVAEASKKSSKKAAAAAKAKKATAASELD
jgi:hypothetical protein